VERAEKIKLRYRTLTGEERATKMRDRDARAAQHEYDHLNGVTIIQRAHGGSEALIVAGHEAAV
jgi:peptide deformylase